MGIEEERISYTLKEERKKKEEEKV